MQLLLRKQKIEFKKPINRQRYYSKKIFKKKILLEGGKLK